MPAAGGDDLLERIAGCRDTAEAVRIQWELDDLYRRVPPRDGPVVLQARERLYQRFPILHGSAVKTLPDGTQIVESLGHHRIPVLAGADRLMIDLRCGRTVYVDKFRYHRTFAGIIEGTPSRDTVEWIMQGHKQSLGGHPGKRGTLLIRPELDESYPGCCLIPPAAFVAELECLEPLTPEKGPTFGSRLTVGWFGNNPRADLFGKIIEDAVIDIPWSDVAEDLDWGML
jgi:hypothetical protein